MYKIATTLKKYLNENKKTTNDGDAQQLIDIISMNPTKYTKYIDLLKTKYNVDFYEYYNDEKYLNDISLTDIKTKDDFLNFDNYIKYAKKIFSLRKIEPPKHIDRVLSFDEIKNIGDRLGFKVKLKEYNGSGNYAAFDLVDTIITPSKLDVNTLIHEIGHFFDHNISKDYIGLAKTITYASSSYEIGKSNEVFAENFLHYFIAPKMLKDKLPNVYSELDSKIPNNFKIIIDDIISETPRVLDMVL